MMSRIDSRHWIFFTGCHFQNGRHNTAQIQHCPISTPFHMWVDYDVPNWFLTLNNFYRSPFSKWPPQYRTSLALFDFKVLNWLLTSKNFYLSPFSKWPPQYRIKSSSEFVTMHFSVHLNLLSVAGLGDFLIVITSRYSHFNIRFSKPSQRQYELLPTLGVRHQSSIIRLLFTC